jgi:hypothetical protein
MLTVFFIFSKLLIPDTLPKRHKCNQDYFVREVILELQSERFRFAGRKTLAKFTAHMNNSICHNGMKVTNALEKANIIRARTRSIHHG